MRRPVHFITIFIPRGAPFTGHGDLFIFEPTSDRGRDLTHPRVAPPWMNPYVGEKNSENFGKFRIYLAWMLHGAVGDAFCYATNRLPARHQYRLQIEEGV
jgi:hypothetical protein